MSQLLQKSFFVLVVLGLISCGSQRPMVENVKLSSSDQDGDIHINLSADLSIGNLQLPSASFPIFLPKLGKEIGTVSLLPSSSSDGQIIVDLNVSETANLDLAVVSLPNGTKVPLIGENKVLKIPVKNIELYLGLSPGSEVIGVAIPIKTFDRIGAKVGSSALMPLFNTNGVVGSAGVYTSKNKGQNGFAMIVDLSGQGNLINSLSPFVAQLKQAPVSYAAAKISRRAERKINGELYKLHRRKARLSLK